MPANACDMGCNGDGMFKTMTSCIIGRMINVGRKVAWDVLSRVLLTSGTYPSGTFCHIYVLCSGTFCSCIISTYVPKLNQFTIFSTWDSFFIYPTLRWEGQRINVILVHLSGNQLGQVVLYVNSSPFKKKGIRYDRTLTQTRWKVPDMFTFSINPVKISNN